MNEREWSTPTTVEGYLQRPYRWIFIPEEAGGFSASIDEFPGCVSQGETLEEAHANLGNAAASWIEEVLYMGQAVPEPFDHL